MQRTASAVTPASFTNFGELLRYLRRRVQLTQRDLGIATGYSEAHISRLEKNQRLPDPTTLLALFVPALDLGQPDEIWVTRLLELANRARVEPAWTLPDGPTPPETGQIIDSLEAIPPPAPHEVPRLHALARLRAHLKAQRRVVLSGLAGAGKTTLAAALARDYQASAPVFWLTLTSGVTTSVDTLIHQITLFLHRWGQSQVTPLLRSPPEATLSLGQQVALLGAGLTQLSDRSQELPLLCFDNIDLVQMDEAVVQVLRHLMRATPAALLLISREELTMLGGGQVRLAGLEQAEGLSFIQELSGQAYGQRRSTAGRPASLSPWQAKRLLAKTGGNPMMLRLALGQLLDAHEPLEPTAFITHLETQPQVSTYLLETVQQRLTPAAWHLLSLIAVFRQPINLYDDWLIELGQAAAGPYDVAAAIAELQRRHLIDHPTQADPHPLVRDYVYAALVANPPRRKRLHQLAAEWLEHETPGQPLEAAYHYTRAGQLEAAAAILAGHVEAIINRGGRSAALAVVDEALAQVRRKRGETTDLLRQLLAIRGDLLVGTLLAAEAEADYRQALALPALPPVRAHIAWRLAQSLAQRGQADQAVQLCRDTAAAIAPSDTLLLARLASVECHALYTLSRLEEASQVGAGALTLTDQLAHLSPQLADTIRARLHHTLSNTLYFRRNYQAALDHSHQLVAVARRAGLRELEYAGLNSLGVLMLEYVGQTELGLYYLDQAEAGFAEIGHSYGLANTLDFKAIACYLRNEHDQALRILDRAEKIVRQIGDLEGLAMYQADRGFILLACGQVTAARLLAERLLNDYPEHDACWHTMYTMALLGVIQMVAEETETALETLSRALTLPATAADPGVRADLYSYLALALLISGNLAGAQQTLEATPPGDVGVWPELNRQLIRGILALAQGDTASAAALAAAAAERADAAGYRLFSLSAARLAAAVYDPPPLAQLPRLLWVIAAPDPP